MLDGIQTKAGLIGYYEGSIKSTLRYLQETPEKKRSWELKNAIALLEKSLESGEEIWQRVKGKE
jgi:hypothetical protein